MQPGDAGIWFAVGRVFDEVGDLVLANRTIRDRVPFEEGDFNLAVGGEQERVPAFFLVFLDGEFAGRMIGADKFCEFLE